MPPALNRYTLQAWSRSQRGRELQVQEERAMQRVLPEVFGRHVLQVGQWGVGDGLLRSSETLHKAVVGTAPGLGAGALAAPERLPILDKSVDAIVLPHTLEFSPAPHSVLREANRVLTDRGRLFVLSFDAWSWWALRQRIGMRYRAFPAGARFVGKRRLCDWLELLDFEVDRVVGYGGTWFGRWFAAGPCGYLLVAKKRVIPLSQVRQPKRAAVRSLVSGVPVPGASSTAAPPVTGPRP